MQFTNSEDTSNLSNEEKKIYNKTINLLNSNFTAQKEDSLEVLNVLKNIFSEKETNISSDTNLSHSTETYFGVINYNKIFNQANEQQFLELFQCLCSIKNIQITDYAIMKQLYEFVIISLLELKENKEIEAITWDGFISCLNIDTLLKFYKRTEINTYYEETFLNYLSHFSDFNLEEQDTESREFNLSKQNYTQHFYIEDKIKNIFYFSSKDAVLKNENLVNIFESILNSTTSTLENNHDLFKYISKVFYNNNLTTNNARDIEDFISNFGTDGKYDNDVIYHSLLNAVLNKDKEMLFAATDDYLAHYWMNVKQSPDLIDADYEFKIEDLSLEDKVVAFFTSYFSTVQPDENTPIFISLLTSFYDKELFKSFMAHYDIPYNIPIREEIVLHDKNNKPIITDHYFSLFEILTYQEKYHIAQDILEQQDALTPFYRKIVENDEIFEYKSQPLTDLFHADEKSLMFFINCGVINESIYLPITFDDGTDEVNSIDPFFYFLHKGYHQAFALLYEKIKAANPQFDLKVYQSDTTLLSIYLAILSSNPAMVPNPIILSILSNENYSLVEPNVDGATSLDYLKKLTPTVGFSTVCLLKSMFDKEQSLILQDGMLEQNIDSLFSKQEEVPKVEWFNRTNLELHLKNLSKEKDNTCVEYIKTMLSNQNHMRNNLLIKDETFFDTLTEQFPNFKEVINFYKGQFRLRKLTGKIYTPPVLLFGEPGIGKTKFAKELAKYLETGYTFIDMGSMTANWLLTGNNGTWKNARQGKILESVMKSNTISPLILMDELDKAKGGEYDASPALYQLLEEVNAKEFNDEFVDFTFNASGIIYIACANSINNISEPLLSRFKIFNVQKPSDSQLDNIIQNIYHEAIKDTNLFEETIEKSLATKLKKYSLRNIKVMIDDAISQVLLEFNSEDLSQMISMNKKIIITEKYITDTHKKATIGFTKG